MTCEGYYKSSQEVFAEVGFQTASKVFITLPLRAPGQVTALCGRTLQQHAHQAQDLGIPSAACHP